MNISNTCKNGIAVSVVKLSSSLPVHGSIGFPQRFVANTLAQAWSQAGQNAALMPIPQQYKLTIYKLNGTSIGTIAYQVCHTTPDITIPYSEMIKLNGSYAYTYSVLLTPISVLECAKQYGLYTSVPLAFTVTPSTIKSTLQAPIDGLIQTTGSWPTLSWQEPQDVLPNYGYRIQVSKDQSFRRDMLVDECTLSTTYSPSNLAWELDRFGTMYWRVNYVQFAWTDKTACSRQTLVESTWSATRSFTSDISPNAVLPADQTIVRNGIWPTLTWTPILAQLEVNGYRIQVSRDASFKSTVVDECVNQRQYSPSGDGATNFMLSNFGTFFWRVSYTRGVWNSLAECKKQQIPAVLWSDVRSFTAAWQPQVVSPNNGETGSEGNWPVLSWKTDVPALATNGYRIQVSKTNDFKVLEVDECKNGTSYQPDSLWWQQARMGNFYWRVNYVRQAWTSQAQCKTQVVDTALWSETRTFVNPMVDKTVQLSSPATGFMSPDGLWPTLQWNARIPSLGQYGYRIQVSTNRNFTGTLTVDECRTTTSYRPTLESWMRDPARNGEFFWRVNYLAQPWNGTENTCKVVFIEPTLWSETRTFVNRPLANPVVLMIADGLQTNNGLWPRLQWSNGVGMAAPFGYRIQVSRDRFFLDARQLAVDECRMQPTYQANTPAWTRTRTGVWYWRVNYARATWDVNNPSSCKNTSVIPSLWSSVRTFNNNNAGDRISAEYDLLGVYSDGTVGNWCDSDCHPPPSSLSQVVAVVRGGTHSLALKSNGTVVAWGCDNEMVDYGQCTIPKGLSNVIAIAAGGTHSLALKNDGTVIAWGNRNENKIKVPSSLKNVVAIVAGIDHSLALKNDGTVVAWGSNRYGQTNVPSSLTNAVAIAGGLGFSLALKSDGTVVKWGNFDIDIARPIPDNLSGVVAMSAFWDHVMFLKADGTVVGAGYASGYELNPPVDLNNLIAIAAGHSKSYALKANGQVVAWNGYDDVPGNGVMLNK